MQCKINPELKDGVYFWICCVLLGILIIALLITLICKCVSNSKNKKLAAYEIASIILESGKEIK